MNYDDYQDSLERNCKNCNCEILFTDTEFCSNECEEDNKFNEKYKNE